MMSELIVIGSPVALRPAVVVAVAVEVMAVVVVVTAAFVMAVVVVVTVAVVVEVAVAVAVAVAAVIMDRDILVHQPRTRRCGLSMTRHTLRSRGVDGTVANVPIRWAFSSYPE